MADYLGVLFDCPVFQTCRCSVSLSGVPSVVWERNLPSVLGVTIYLAIGDAVTIVPATAIEGDRGWLGLNSGWRTCGSVS